MTSPATYPLANAFGWTLLHFLWQGAIVALLLWCALGLIGMRRSHLRYGISCVALAMLVAAPLVTFARLAFQDRLLAASVRVPVSSAVLFIHAQAAAAPVPWTARVTAALDLAIPWLLLAWCAGAGYFLARLVLGFFAVRALRTSGHKVADDLQRVFDSLHTQLGISRAVQLMRSACIDAPTVIGWLRPVVLLPTSCLSGLAPAQIEAILCHELAHIRRHDYLVSVLQSIVESLLFYHPAVWWVSRQVRRERECCCDDFAVRAGANPLTYARALAFLEEQRPRVPQLVLAANGGVLKMRVQRLLHRTNSSCAPRPALMALFGIAAFFLLGFAARQVWAQAHPTQAASIKAFVRASAAPAAHSTSLDGAKPAAATPQSSPARGVSSISQQPTQQDGMTHPEAALPPQHTAQAETTSVPLLRYIQLAAKAQADIPATPSQGAPSPQDSPNPRVSAGVMQGMLLTQVNPVYPPIAQEAHVQGAVVLHAIISKEGKVKKLQVISGPQMLIQSAVEAVQQWTYRPFMLNGQPVEVETAINVNYTLGPDLSCTYYDLKNLQHQGTCEEGSTDKGNYYCRENDDKQLLQPQPSCESKVKRLQESRPNSFSPAEVHLVLPGSAFASVAANDSSAGTEPTHDQAGNVVRRLGGDGIVRPIVIHQVEPEYTEEARKAKFQGIVTVGCIVNRQGVPEDVHVVRGIGMGLNDKAIEAVKQYKFKPAMQDGKPVSVEVNIQVDFRVF